MSKDSSIFVIGKQMMAACHEQLERAEKASAKWNSDQAARELLAAMEPSDRQIIAAWLSDRVAIARFITATNLHSSVLSIVERAWMEDLDTNRMFRS